MKLDAIVNVRMPRQNILVPNVTVPIDADYVEANELDIRSSHCLVSSRSSICYNLRTQTSRCGIENSEKKRLTKL